MRFCETNPFVMCENAALTRREAMRCVEHNEDYKWVRFPYCRGIDGKRSVAPPARTRRVSSNSACPTNLNVVDPKLLSEQGHGFGEGEVGGEDFAAMVLL